MKLKNLLGWSSALCLSASVLQAQETNDAEKLNKQLKQLQEKFEKQQREMRENFERMMREQQAQIDALKKQLATQTNTAPAAAQPAASAPAQQPMTTPVTAIPGPDLARPWRPSDPIRLGGAQNFINLAFDALVAAGASTPNDIDGPVPGAKLELGGHDPKQ